MKIFYIFSFILSISLNKKLFPKLKYDLSNEPINYCTTWGTSNVQTLKKNLPEITLSNNSLRQIVRVSISGESIRIKFSNKYGESILKIQKSTISNSKSQGTSEIYTNSTKIITFSGKEKINIAAGEEIYSDTINYSLKALSEIAISIYFGIVPSKLTGHGNSVTNSFIEEGDKIDNNIFSLNYKTPHWYFIESIEVISNKLQKSIVCFGDSITEGVGSTIDKHNRWPDKLAEKLQKNKIYSNLAVVNAGIGGNRICDQGLERFEHDVLNITGIKYIIILYGINDMIHLNTTANEIISAYKQIIEKAHKNNLYIYAGTLLPAGKWSTWISENEKERLKVNEWIRNTKKEDGGFDNYFDFDKNLKDNNNQTNLAEIYDSGDGLHPSAKGYEQIVNTIDNLDLFIINN